MKIIVTLAQLTVLCAVAYLLIDNGIPTRDQDLVMFLLLTITPLITLYYIHFWSVSDIRKLMNERRLLEEQAKVDKLKSDTK
jgi:hypothetical protein